MFWTACIRHLICSTKILPEYEFLRIQWSISKNLLIWISETSCHFSFCFATFTKINFYWEILHWIFRTESPEKKQTFHCRNTRLTMTIQKYSLDIIRIYTWNTHKNTAYCSIFVLKLIENVRISNSLH